MAILGQIIKSAITLRNTLSSEVENAQQAQHKQLRLLLESAQHTAFGIYHGFPQLLQEDDIVQAYRQEVPIVDYHQINDRWWLNQQKYPNITWPGQPEYFALSSGTTGKKSKRIPVTDEMLKSFRDVGISQALTLDKFDLPAELFEKEVLMLSSSSNLDERDGHKEGEISGINASNLPPWFGGFYRPGPDIAEIDNWDQRVEKIAKEAPSWDIGAIAGIPSWVQMMLQTIIERNNLNNIHDIWPNLSLYLSGGVAFEPYRQSMEQLLGKPITYLDTYLASEGFFAYTARPGTMNMKLAINHGIYYEFIPFDDRGFDETGNLLENPEVLGIEEVEEEVDYALLISTPAGSWRYMIGDTIKFKNLETQEMIISGRTKYFLNVVGSQLSEEKINTAINAVCEELNIEVHEFAVAAMKNEQKEWKHQWIIGLDDQQIGEEKLKVTLDNQLKELNKNYRVARQKALKGIDIRVVTNQQIYDWLESRKKKGGQIKLPKVMKTEMMQDFLDWLPAYDNA